MRSALRTAGLVDECRGDYVELAEIGTDLVWKLGIFVCLLSFSGWSESYPLPFPEARLAGAVYAACTTEEGSTDERRRIAFDGGCDDARLLHPPDG